ncbi:sucrase ferredoxin domain-containing protein [Diplodia corticola]|uniref:Sucrase ferredoxin domain-containing protein n=1 Tax=Diplodia corticola TaxID=236234 RepID=A0A1J9RJE0_9PEZI|nr:sucrase ferredoxin domain-containing protein [Diplodia corticola]OJD40776.1 sucrase ferredoxin domain-containing protein [Diplodia corticola]
MAAALKSLWGKVGGGAAASQHPDGFSKAPASDQLFPKTNPTVDGEECLRDCETCTIKYPRKWSVDEDDDLYGHVKGWSTHMVVATGKSDWVRDVADEKGSIMEAVDKCGIKPSNGKMMLSASDMPVPNEHHTQGAEAATTVLLLPSFTIFDNVTPSLVPALIQNYVDLSPTNTTPLIHSDPPQRPPSNHSAASSHKSHKSHHHRNNNDNTHPAPDPSALIPRDCPHDYLIMLCSHKTRDARCGQSAPLLRREFERHLRPLGLYRDLHDERPGGCAVYFINHVGGHKYAANVIIYRRVGSAGVLAPPVVEQEKAMNGGGGGGGESNGHAGGEAVEEEDGNGGEARAPSKPPIREAAQCMWLARVRPEDCENIVKYTILQGKLVKPERQLRGGFDRGRQLVSW